MLPIKFYKMHGLGNDFIIINNINSTLNVSNFPIQLWSNRNLGIGFDQLLLLEKSDKADFACRIFNADGSEAEQCGNGMRCIARFIHEENLSIKQKFTIETKGGAVVVHIFNYEKISVSICIPHFKPAEIPFLADKLQKQYTLQLPSTKATVAVLSMGNPHVVLKVPCVKNYPVAEIGPHLMQHPSLPQGANVGFMEIVNRCSIRLRTFERGTGETFSCGTNACAAVVAGIINNWLDSKVIVELRYGNLLIEWPDESHPVIMTGPASRVFSGSFG